MKDEPKYFIPTGTDIDIDELCKYGAEIQYIPPIKDYRDKMKVKFKKLHTDAKLPVKAHSTDAGFDLVAISREWDEQYDVWNYGTGLAFEIPENHVGLIFPRSSIYKKEQMLSNAVGVIDHGYSGEIVFKFRDTKETNFLYEIGEKIGQMVIIPYPEIELEEVQELSESERGENGFGSTGK